MSYTTTITDSKGKSKTITITEAESIEAVKNDYAELMRIYNPNYVRIERIAATEGEALHLKVTVNAPSHYLSDPNDISPKLCNDMSVHIVCYPGYPIEKIKAYYSEKYRLASPNVFTYGSACINDWIPFKSSILTVVEKLVRDIIHYPTVNLYDSPACSKLIDWHKKGVASKKFPTIKPKLLYKAESTPTQTPTTKTPPLPPRKINSNRPTPPPMPKRNH